MLNLHKILFLNSLIMSTLITISSFSWISMWMGLEINLLSMIPLLTSNKNMYETESAMKYFITQTLASTIILFSIILMSNKMEFINFNLNNYFMMMFNSAICMKLGAAPFHFWFPEIIEGLNWFNCLLILTWQKIAPMIIILMNFKINYFFFMIIISSSIIGSIMSLNQNNLRKILAYSSINHISWMMASMMNNQMIWFIYFFTYSIISLNLIMMFNTKNIFSMNQMFNKINNNKMFKLTFMLNFLSLGGLPPFIGFLPKWLTINNLIMNNLPMISLMMIIFSLIILFMYLRLCLTSMLIYSSENILYKSQNNNFFLSIINSINISLLIFCTLMFNIN